MVSRFAIRKACAAALVFLLAIAPAGLLLAGGTSAPGEIKLENPVEIAVPGVDTDAVAVLKDNETIIVVGGKSRPPDDHDTPTTDLPPAGAFVNLKTKAVNSFTNGHKGRIVSVAVASDGSRIYTGSLLRDTSIRIWDVKAKKTLDPIMLSDDAIGICEIACMTASPKIVATVGELIFLIDPIDIGKKANLSFNNGEVFATVVRPRYKPMVFSPGDRFLACPTLGGGLVIWEVKNSTVVYCPNLLPVGADLQDHFGTSALTFTKDANQLIVLAPQNPGHQRKAKSRDQLPSREQQGLFLVDFEGKRVVPIGMGHAVATISFALHPSEKWLATVGTSWPEKPDPNTPEKVVTELRVHDFQTRSVAVRMTLPEKFVPHWVGFTPDGRKLVTVSFGSDQCKVKAWDFVTGKR